MIRYQCISYQYWGNKKAFECSDKMKQNIEVWHWKIKVRRIYFGTRIGKSYKIFELKY